MKCPTCGNPVLRDASVCPYCESPLSRQAPAPAQMVRSINVKWDDTSGEQAADRVESILANARAGGTKVVILIHGYGSGGQGGGAIRESVRERLADLLAERRVRTVIFGERFGPSNDEAIRLASQFQSLLAPHVFGAKNGGVTIVGF